MNSMKKYSLFYVAGLLALAACSNSDGVTDENGQLLHLRVSQQNVVSVSDIETRAASNLYTSTTGFDGTETVKVWFNSAESDYSVGTPSGATMKSTLFGGSLAYPVTNTGTMPIWAVYPSTSASSHTVAADQTGDAAYKASDLMFATGSVNLAVADRSDAITDLTFAHQLVKLTLQVTKGEGIADITQVKMVNVKRTVALTPAASALTQGALTSATGGDEILIFSGHQTGTAAASYSCVFPAQAWSNADFIVVTADEQDIVFCLNKDDFESGKEYVLSLDIVGSVLGMAVNIADWNPATGSIATYSPNRFVIGAIANQPHTGSPVTPEPTVYYNGTLLVKDTDYTLVYENNTNVGTATVYIVGIGTYVGKAASKTFQIVSGS